LGTRSVPLAAGSRPSNKWYPHSVDM
jgi:hypothetical protein